MSLVSTICNGVGLASLAGLSIFTCAKVVSSYNSDPEIKLGQIGLKVNAYVEPTLFSKKITVQNINFDKFVKPNDYNPFNNGAVKTKDPNMSVNGPYPKTLYKEDDMKICEEYELEIPSIFCSNDKVFLFSFEYPNDWNIPNYKSIFKNQCKEASAYTQVIYKNSSKKFCWDL